MDGPRIAIIGSPWLRDSDGKRVEGDVATAHDKLARLACTELGRELADSGCRLFVYSAEEHSIEPEVVAGYVSVRKDRHAIEFRHSSEGGGRFPEQRMEDEPIYDRTDPSEQWEVSFYRSLKDADGVLLFGGHSTVLIAGHVALAFDKPVAPVACFHGTARAVWKDLRPGGSLTSEDYDAMGRDWGAGSAKAIVASLVRRCELNSINTRAREMELAQYREQAAERQGARPALIATIVSFVLVLIILVIGITADKGGAAILVPFVFGLTLAGVAGAGVRFLRSGATDGTAKALVAGAIAGFVFSVLYLLPQLSDSNGLISGATVTPSARLQVLVGHILGLMGGLCADAVLTSFQREGETRARQLPSVTPRASPQPQHADEAQASPAPPRAKKKALA